MATKKNLIKRNLPYIQNTPQSFTMSNTGSGRESMAPSQSRAMVPAGNVYNTSWTRILNEGNIRETGKFGGAAPTPRSRAMVPAGNVYNTSWTRILNEGNVRETGKFGGAPPSPPASATSASRGFLKGGLNLLGRLSGTGMSVGGYVDDLNRGEEEFLAGRRRPGANYRFSPNPAGGYVENDKDGKPIFDTPLVAQPATAQMQSQGDRSNWSTQPYDPNRNIRGSFQTTSDPYAGWTGGARSNPEGPFAYMEQNGGYGGQRAFGGGGGAVGRVGLDPTEERYNELKEIINKTFKSKEAQGNKAEALMALQNNYEKQISERDQTGIQRSKLDHDIYDSDRKYGLEASKLAYQRQRDAKGDARLDLATQKEARMADQKQQEIDLSRSKADSDWLDNESKRLFTVSDKDGKPVFDANSASLFNQFLASQNDQVTDPETGESVNFMHLSEQKRRQVMQGIKAQMEMTQVQAQGNLVSGTELAGGFAGGLAGGLGGKFASKALSKLPGVAGKILGFAGAKTYSALGAAGGYAAAPGSTREQASRFRVQNEIENPGFGALASTASPLAIARSQFFGGGNLIQGENGNWTTEQDLVQNDSLKRQILEQEKKAAQRKRAQKKENK